MKLCHKQWWPGNARHQSALSDLAKVPASDCLLGPQCWDQQWLKVGFMGLLIQFVLQLFVDCEHVYRTWDWKREQKKGKECLLCVWPLRNSVKDLGQHHTSALSWGTGVRVAFHPNLKEVWRLIYFTEVSSACGGAEDWSRVGKLSLSIPSCGWKAQPTLQWIFSGTQSRH